MSYIGRGMGGRKAVTVRRSLLLLVGLGAALAASAAERAVIAEVRYESRAELQALGARFQHLVVDEARGTATVEAAPEDIDTLASAFAEEIGSSMGRPGGRVSAEAREKLASYRGPATCASCATRSSAPSS